MRSASAFVLFALSACSGGGGHTFTPSADLDVSHPWLRGDWIGTSRSNQTGEQKPAELLVFFPAHISTSDQLSFDLSISGGSQTFGEGTLQADGLEVRGSEPLSGLSFVATMTSDHTRAIGRYTVANGGSPDSSGTFDVTKPLSHSLTIDTIETPTWSLRIETRR